MRKLIVLSKDYENQYEKYINRFQNLKMEIDIANRRTLSFDAYLNLLQQNASFETNNTIVRDVFFLLVNGDIIGVMDFRYNLDAHYNQSRGNIGIEILPEFQKQGHGKWLLQQAIKIARERGMQKLLLVCDEENIASEELILSCGGLYEDTRKGKNENVKRFLLETDKKREA